MSKRSQLYDELENYSTDCSDDDNRSYGHCEGETFKCCSCSYYVIIEKAQYPGGDIFYCTICDDMICDKCILQCDGCNEDICKQCKDECFVCNSTFCDKCTEDDIIMIKCIKCKQFRCGDCDVSDNCKKCKCDK
jgi:hypothetical protein